MNEYQRLELMYDRLKKERQELLDGLVKNPPGDYAGFRHIGGQVLAMDKVIGSIEIILKDG